MSKNSELLVAVVVIVILAGLLMSSFLRHLRWEERLFKWRMRVAMHCIAFVALIAAAGYAYVKLHHGAH